MVSSVIELPALRGFQACDLLLFWSTRREGEGVGVVQDTHCNAGERVGRLIGKLKPSQDESELLKYGRPAGYVCYRAHTLLLEPGEQMYQKVGLRATALCEVYCGL